MLMNMIEMYQDIINKYGATMSKKSVSPSGERTFTFVFL